MNGVRRILVIDDDVDQLFVARSILERRGYEVRTFRDCDNLLGKIRDYEPELIFMDLVMPGINGLEATGLLKSDACCRHIPLIYFSGREDIRDLASLFGADGFLRKPFKVEEMLNITMIFTPPAMR